MAWNGNMDMQYTGEKSCSLTLTLPSIKPSLKKPVQLKHLTS